MRSTRTVLASTASAVLSVGATTALAAPAAVAPGTTPQAVCGSGHRTVNSAPVGSLGTVYPTYNSANGENCVATIRDNPGPAVDMSARVYVPGTEEGADDYGRYTSYAGPVYVSGRARCVDRGGHIGNVHVQVHGSDCGALEEHRVTFTR
ncbi:spore-associated protein [Streptomyces poriticola]|uniref:spore-associated protein n=1 Tax=Streptomyces poriticola TaxID=3120506 RepID=UPI002FCE51B3